MREEHSVKEMQAMHWGHIILSIKNVLGFFYESKKQVIHFTFKNWFPDLFMPIKMYGKDCGYTSQNKMRASPNILFHALRFPKTVELGKNEVPFYRLSICGMTKKYTA